jgi:DNA invertase Pin-like site-specific DNA recombinase
VERRQRGGTRPSSSEDVAVTDVDGVTSTWRTSRASRVWASVVWKLDRLGRSLRYLIDTVTALEERGVGFRSVAEAMDTTTPGGKLVLHLFGALAEFERDLIRERTQAGLAAARARGRTGGRPTVMTTPARGRQQLYASGEHSVAAIAATLGVSRACNLPTPRRQAVHYQGDH